MKLLTETLELRGIKNVVSSKGNTYILVNCESEEGDPMQFYCKDVQALPQGLKKGDKVRCKLDYNKRFNSLVLLKVDKLGA